MPSTPSFRLTCGPETGLTLTAGVSTPDSQGVNAWAEGFFTCQVASVNGFSGSLAFTCGVTGGGAVCELPSVDVAPDPYGGYLQDGEYLEQVSAGASTSFQVGVALQGQPSSGTFQAQLALYSESSVILASEPITVVAPPFSFSCDPPATIASGPAPVAVTCTVVSDSPVMVMVGAVGAEPGSPAPPANTSLPPSGFAPTPEGVSGLVAAKAPSSPGPWVFQFTASRWGGSQTQDITVTAS